MCFFFNKYANFALETVCIFYSLDLLETKYTNILKAKFEFLKKYPKTQKLKEQNDFMCFPSKDAQKFILMRNLMSMLLFPINKIFIIRAGAEGLSLTLLRAVSNYFDLNMRMDI